MQKIVFEDTTVVKSPYVIIDGVEHEVYNGTYQGGTDLNAQTFNQMQDNIETAINSIELSGGGDEVGTVKMFSGSTAPQGWLICDGSAISRTEYAELFSAIGTAYGSGNGTTTFNIPNIKGRTVVGLDNNDTDFNTLGNTLGEKTHTLTIDEMPSHKHDLTIIGNGSERASGVEWNTSNETRKYAGDMIDATGGNQPHNIIQPSIVLNYIIKASATTTTQGQIIDSLSGDSTTDAPSVHATKLLNTYSTDEIKIGTWIDGKPLYRKVIESTSGNASVETVIGSISNFEYLKTLTGTIINSINVSVNFPFIFNANNLGELFISSNGSINCLVTNGEYANRPIKVIIEYTKTTD